MKLFGKTLWKKGSALFRHGWKISLLILLLGGGLALFLFYAGWAATFDMKKVGEMPERNTVFDVDGNIYSRLAGANRLRVSLDEVSPLFVEALLAREDTRFYQHRRNRLARHLARIGARCPEWFGQGRREQFDAAAGAQQPAARRAHLEP